MFKRTVSEADLRQLKAARDAANERYVEALTALDASKGRLPEIPAPPPPPDEHQITPLNERWRILPDPPPGGAGWRDRVAGLIWKVVAPLFARQQAFNSAVVDHINRNLVVNRATRASIETVIQLAREQFEALVTFEWRLMHFLQQVTGYVDAADRETAGLMRRINEDTRELLEPLDHRTSALAGAISGVGDELLKRWETIGARDHRFDGRLEALLAAQEDIRATLVVVQRATSAFKRELERSAHLQSSPAAPVTRTEGAQPANAGGTAPMPGTLEGHKYVGFEDQFRGSPDDIRARVSEYLPFFDGAADVLDVGCGRGEFLDLLRERGIRARGLDINHEMVEICRSRGLDVVEGDALAYLTSLADQSLGGLFAAQFVEHLDPAYLLRLLDVAFDKLQPDAPIVLETINPACWYAFFESYIRDITHVRPLHPDTLQYLLRASGFRSVSVRYRAPFPPGERLQHIVVPDSASRTTDGVQALLAYIAGVSNANTDRLNALLFTYLDYAAIGRRA